MTEMGSLSLSRSLSAWNHASYLPPLGTVQELRSGCGGCFHIGTDGHRHLFFPSAVPGRTSRSLRTRGYLGTTSR